MMIGKFTALKLNDQIVAAGIPIDGVSIGKPNNKLTWRIDFKPEATKEQKIQAQQILADFDKSKIPDPVSELETRVAALEAKVNSTPKKR
jgi:hypothetical protein